MVDDGATDGSAAIAERHAERDPRLRLVRQSNHGLGHARNTGVQAASGEFLAFVDSDDKLPPDALELLLASLDRTGSDFATGNIHRFTSTRDVAGAVPAQDRSCAAAPQTHVSRFRWLLSDRMAQNKLWRRSFWDAARPAVPRGRAARGHPRRRPRPLPRPLGRRALAAGLPLPRCARTASPRSPSAAAELRTLRDRIAAVEQARRSHRAPRAVRLAPLVRPVRGRRGPALPPRRPRRGRRRVPGALPRARAGVPASAPAPASRTTCRRSSA